MRSDILVAATSRHAAKILLSLPLQNAYEASKESYADNLTLGAIYDVPQGTGYCPVTGVAIVNKDSLVTLLSEI